MKQFHFHLAYCWDGDVDILVEDVDYDDGGGNDDDAYDGSMHLCDYCYSLAKVMHLLDSCNYYMYLKSDVSYPFRC